MGSARDIRIFHQDRPIEVPEQVQPTSIGPSSRGFIIYWVCDEHRVPITIRQEGGGGSDAWKVCAGGWNIINIYRRPDGYHYNDWGYCLDDIQAIVDAITDFTGEGYKQVVIFPIGYPNPIIRYPPYFEPIFRDNEAEQSFYRIKLKDAQLRRKLEEQLQIVWRR